MLRNPLGVILSTAICATVLAVPAAAQTGDNVAPQQEVSLADAARRAREQKKEAPPAKQVWTNENIPQVPKEEPAAEKAAGEEGNAAAEGDQSKAAKPGKEEEDAKKAAELEAQWRQKFTDARKKLADDEKELDIMQREFGVKQQQYFSDPNLAVRDQYQRDSGPGGGGEVNNLAIKIEEKKKQIEADRQAISDLEDGLRKAGLPPGWSRTP